MERLGKTVLDRGNSMGKGLVSECGDNKRPERVKWRNHGLLASKLSTCCGLWAVGCGLWGC